MTIHKDSTLIPNWFVDSDLQAKPRAVYLALLFKTQLDLSSSVTLSHQELSFLSGYSVAATKTALADLKKHGLVTWAPQAKSGNLYTITDPASIQAIELQKGAR